MSQVQFNSSHFKEQWTFFLKNYFNSNRRLSSVGQSMKNLIWKITKGSQHPDAYSPLPHWNILWVLELTQNPFDFNLGHLKACPNFHWNQYAWPTFDLFFRQSSHDCNIWMPQRRGPMTRGVWSLAWASDYNVQPCEYLRSDVDLLKRIKGKHLGPPMLLEAIVDNKKPVAAKSYYFVLMSPRQPHGTPTCALHAVPFWWWEFQ